MSSGDPGERGGAPPRLPGHVIPRPRLVRGIHRLLDQYPVLVVAASAGSGKTTAVIQAALAHGLSASEAGVPLARALAGTDLVLVLDRVETIGGCAGAEGLLDALVGSLPVRTSLLDDGVTAERASALGRVSPDRTRGPAPCRRWWRSGAVTSPGRGIISAPPKPVPTPPRSGTAGG
ncbi:hypothetical protein ACWGMA_36670 [Streptomyces asiaticus]